MTILVIGGAGYVGSHVCKALKKAGFIPVVFDNLSQGHPWAVKWGPLIQADIHDAKALDEAMVKHQPVGVIHLAACLNVRESMVDPGKYYHNNLSGSLSILQAMARARVKFLIFSSSAAVYGIPSSELISEDHSKSPINSYGRSKWMVEEMIGDFGKSHGIASVNLRYFNAAGADPEGEIGEAHHPEIHLIPLILLTALNKRLSLSLFGTDHPTPDGTCVRDFIHVADLATAHVKALQWLMLNPQNIALNLGTGKGNSVKEVIQAAECVTKRKIPLEITPRSPFDPPQLVADPQKAKALLNWNPHLSDLETIIETAWNWHKK